MTGLEDAYYFKKSVCLSNGVSNSLNHLYEYGYSYFRKQNLWKFGIQKAWETFSDTIFFR